MANEEREERPGNAQPTTERKRPRRRRLSAGAGFACSFSRDHHHRFDGGDERPGTSPGARDGGATGAKLTHTTHHRRLQRSNKNNHNKHRSKLWRPRQPKLGAALRLRPARRTVGQDCAPDGGASVGEPPELTSSPSSSSSRVEGDRAGALFCRSLPRPPPPSYFSLPSRAGQSLGNLPSLDGETSRALLEKLQRRLLVHLTYIRAVR